MSDPSPLIPPSGGAHWSGPAPPFGAATVELDGPPAADGTLGFSLVARDQSPARRVAVGRCRVDDTSFTVRVLRVAVSVVAVDDVPTVRSLLALPGWFDAEAARLAAAGVEVSVSDPALRQILRDAGYGGFLRAPLRRPPAGPVRPELGAGENRGDGSHKGAALARFVQELVPTARISAGSEGGASRASRWLAGLANGQLRLLELRVGAGGQGAGGWSAGGPDGPAEPRSGRPLRLRVPDRADLLAEQVALAADMAAGVLGRFPWLRVLAVSFDQGDFGFRSGRLGGYARPQAQSDIHVNGAYVLGDLVGQHGRYGARPGFHPPTDRSAIEDVVIHELWHAVEHDFEVRHFRESIEMRRELGRYFGVETLERVFDPGHEGALARLRAEVSIYATENRREATAELFTEWWQNPRPRSAAATFGALVERYVTS